MTGPRLEAVTDGLTDEDRRWQERAERFGEDTLRDVKTVAGRWSATIAALAGLVGLVALVSGPRTVDGLDPVWRVACGVVVFLALGSAAMASWLAAAAANGRIVTTLQTAARYREAYEREEGRARRQLWWSRFLTATAGALLVVAIAVSWYGPRTSGKVLIVHGTMPATTQCLPFDATAVVLAAPASTVSVSDSCP